MTAQRDLKRIIRNRQGKTGESYTAARTHVMRERAALLGIPEETQAKRSEAVVLKVNLRSLRVRFLGEQEQITVRTRNAYQLFPGQLIDLQLEKRWTWRDAPYASGTFENPRTDIQKLGLQPLPLHDDDTFDLRDGCEPYTDPDPYAPLWRDLTAEPRQNFEMDAIAWGALPDYSEEAPICDASELLEAGDPVGARKIAMDVLATDIRCIDAHSILGNIEFPHNPERAMVHYDIGIRIGELSLPPDYDGVLIWGYLYNRPFLRCLHGYGLCQWRLENHQEAEAVFLRILSLNPNDNQGIRFLLPQVREGLAWDDCAE